MNPNSPFLLFDSHPQTKAGRRLARWFPLVALALTAMGQANYATPYPITALAGSVGLASANDGTGSVAQFSYPQGAAVDANGNVYVADSFSSTIRKVTSAGVVTIIQ